MLIAAAFGLFGTLLPLLFAAGLSAALSCVASAVPLVGAGDDWPSHGGGAEESGYSRLDRIKASNVSKLGLVWSLQLPGESTLEATPLAIHGVLYFTGSYAAVYAVDARKGRLLWKYDPETWKFNPAKMHLIFPANRGVAYADGRVFAAALDGRLFSLDAKTGKLLWSVETTTRESVQAVTGAPRTFNGKVIIGQAGADFGVRGYVTAYEAATGRQVWRFYVTPGSPEESHGDPAMERAAATWTGEYWKSGTGGGVWDNITFDPELNRIYLGTGNAAPYDPVLRSPGGGDNLYTASIVALDADTGKYVWHYQVNPRDSWDFDCTQRMTLADLVINGEARKVLMQAPKNGFFYVLDRLSGKLISAEKTGKVNWADHIDVLTGRPVEANNIRYESGDVTIRPGPLGAHSWQDMSFSPRTGLMYIPYMQSVSHFAKRAPQAGEVSVGGLSITAVKEDPDDGKGSLLAWDPILQAARWKVPLGTLWNGGTLATAGDVVFQGAADGYFTAYDAASGERLWRFYAGLGILAAPISYTVQGRQQVSVLVGYGGSAALGSKFMHVGWKYGAQPRTLLTFALGGKAAIPISAPPDLTVKALDDPKLEILASDVEAGRKLFGACALCHGRDLVAAGAPAPDLRESQVALDADGLWAIVHDGALMSRGMPRFEALTREQVMQIFSYIRAGARTAIGTQQANDHSANPR